MNEYKDIRNYDTFKKIFDTDKELYKVFKDFAEYTTFDVFDSNHDIFVFKRRSIKYEEYIQHVLKEHIIEKCENVVASYIEKLVRYGLIRYDVEKPYKTDNTNEREDEERLRHYKQLGHPSKDSKLILVESVLSGGCTGAFFYGRLLKEQQELEESEKFNKEFEKTFIDSVHETLDPDIEKIKKLAQETEKKLTHIEKELKQNITKNIGVLSIFVAVITLLLGNALSIYNYATFGVTGILIVNASTILGITCLVALVEIVVLKGKQNILNVILLLSIIILCISVICILK